MYPIPRAKIGGPSVTGQYGEEDDSDRGLDDITLREDDLYSMNLGSEVIPGSRPAWMTMLEEPDFRKLHVDPFPKKSNQSVKSYGTKASTFSPIYDARHMFHAHPSIASYSVDGDLKPPWDTSSGSGKRRGKNTILIVLGASALLFLVAAVTAGALYAVVEDAESTASANRSQGKGAIFTSTSPRIDIHTSSAPETSTTSSTTTLRPTTTTELSTTTLTLTSTAPHTSTSTSTSTTTTTTTTTSVEVNLPPATTEETTTTTTTTTELPSTIVVTTPMTAEATTTPSATTTTTTTTTTTPQPQYIFITVGRGLLHTPTDITCLWTHDQAYGLIVLEAYDVDLDVSTVMVAFQDDGQHGSFYPDV
ncbi:hypothetical protein ElyMa_002399800 [Elysia marginata]|uniref:Uncharacterized protein n=1 Tax=Elysia marginata TaxID=1093978 RepID=A0AAV4GDG4_9GAST|nr:hypothetical protein ElyMa_002399800 [Elysia marginata]